MWHARLSSTLLLPPCHYPHTLRLSARASLQVDQVLRLHDKFVDEAGVPKRKMNLLVLHLCLTHIHSTHTRRILLTSMIGGQLPSEDMLAAARDEIYDHAVAFFGCPVPSFDNPHVTGGKNERAAAHVTLRRMPTLCQPQQQLDLG